MNDSLDIFELFKDNKEIADLINEIKKLRELFYSQQYDQMQQHINTLTCKYFVETGIWNLSHPTKPVTYQQAYDNAESFLRCKGFHILIKNGEKVERFLTAEEISSIKNVFGIM